MSTREKKKQEFVKLPSEIPEGKGHSTRFLGEKPLPEGPIPQGESEAVREAVTGQESVPSSTKMEPSTTNKDEVPRKRGGPPTPRAEIILRLRIIEGLMFRGFLGRDIQKALETQFKKRIPWKTVQKYIRHVGAMWEEEDAIARPHRRARQLRQLHDAADELRGNQQWREWIEIQRLIARIEGNLAPTQKDVVIQGKFDGWTIEELEHYVKTQEVPARIRSGEKGSTVGLLPGGSS